MKILSIIFGAALFISTSVMALEVSPDGPRIVQLNEDAASVIVGNPAHASVVMDNPRMLIINAGIPGMTRLTVLGRNGNVILSENIIVSGASDGFVRVRNACINGGENCQPTKMYYCEEGDSCHNVIVNEPTIAGDGGDSGADSASLELDDAVGEGE